MRFLTFFVISFYFVTLMLSFGETESALEKAEALTTELKFYEALVALEPLLMSDKKSESQEEALWLANALSEGFLQMLEDEYETAMSKYWKASNNPEPDRSPVNRPSPPSSNPVTAKKVGDLNQLGADIRNAPLSGGDYAYYYGFLKRLLELYPHSSWAPVAEYYLIQEGYPVPQDVDQVLKALNAYVKKYAKSGLAEVYMAYLDIAHFNHELWAVLTEHPRTPHLYEPHLSEFTSDDPEKNKARAAACKATALKYYAKFVISGYKGRYDSDNRESALESYERLKQGEPPQYEYLIFD